MAQAYRYIRAKNPYKKKLGDWGEIIVYPFPCSVNGAFNAEAGYFLVKGDKEKLQKLGYEPGYYRYVNVNLDDKPAFYKQKVSDDMAAEEMAKLRKSKTGINITITPKYKDLGEDEVCKDFIKKGIYVERKEIHFDISASHMDKLKTHKYGAFYFANVASFSGHTVKSSAMKGIVPKIVRAGGYYFVCNAYGDRKEGRSLVIRGVSEISDKHIRLVFLKAPKDENYSWEHVFSMPVDITKFWSISFHISSGSWDITPIGISETLTAFYNNKPNQPLRLDKYPIVFSVP